MNREPHFSICEPMIECFGNSKNAFSMKEENNMKGVTKVFLGIILILMSLSLCCCGAEPTEKSPGEVNEILDVSKILISASLQSELKNDSFSDKDIVICAYFQIH